MTATTGDVNKEGDLVGALRERIRDNGTSHEVPRYAERPGLDDRLLEAGADVASLRRMLGLKPAVA